MLDPNAAKLATASEVTSHLDRMLERSAKDPLYMETLSPLPELSALGPVQTITNLSNSALNPLHYFRVAHRLSHRYHQPAISLRRHRVWTGHGIVRPPWSSHFLSIRA